jgi:hypothetical protein
VGLCRLFDLTAAVYGLLRQLDPQCWNVNVDRAVFFLLFLKKITEVSI